MQVLEQLCETCQQQGRQLHRVRLRFNLARLHQEAAGVFDEPTAECCIVCDARMKLLFHRLNNHAPRVRCSLAAHALHSRRARLRAWALHVVARLRFACCCCARCGHPGRVEADVHAGGMLGAWMPQRGLLTGDGVCCRDTGGAGGGGGGGGQIPGEGGVADAAPAMRSAAAAAAVATLGGAAAEVAVLRIAAAGGGLAGYRAEGGVGREAGVGACVAAALASSPDTESVCCKHAVARLRGICGRFRQFSVLYACW